MFTESTFQLLATETFECKLGSDFKLGTRVARIRYTNRGCRLTLDGEFSSEEMDLIANALHGTEDHLIAIMQIDKQAH